MKGQACFLFLDDDDDDDDDDDNILSVGLLLPFEDFMSILLSPGQVN